MDEFLPIAAPSISQKEEEYVARAMASKWISYSGEFVDQFESEFAEACNVKHAIPTSNGTTALHLALLALDLKAGDEVLVPSLTFVATANAVQYCGAKPIFVDVDPTSLCLDPKNLHMALSEKTKGIIAVHLYGHPADMDLINQFADENNLWVIEDAAEAHFAKYKGRVVGGLGKMATFSFFGNKILTSGEGGAITTDDDELKEKIILYKNHGQSPTERYYFPVIGYNYRLTNVACAILCAQLKRREEIIERRKQIYALYNEILRETPGITPQPIKEWADMTPWLYSVIIDERKFGINRDQLIEDLKHHGIDSRPFFIPLHKLPPYRDKQPVGRGPLNNTEALASTGLNLPTFFDLTNRDVERVCRVIIEAGRQKSI